MSAQLSPLPSDWLDWSAERLEREVREHNERYWVSAQPIISDYDYDRSATPRCTSRHRCSVLIACSCHQTELILPPSP